MANKSLAHQRDFYLIWLLFYLSVVSVPNLVLNTVIVMGKKMKFSEAGHIRRNYPQLLLTNGSVLSPVEIWAGSHEVPR